MDIKQEKKEIDELNREAAKHIAEGRRLNQKARKTVARAKVLFGLD